jgi:hypothetical protein
MFLLILAAAAIFGGFFALAMFAGRRPNDSRQQRPDEQRLPTPCTCGARRFCRVGCAALARSVHPAGDSR